ncbi:MAG: hypothetical protein ACYCO4_07360 [Sulfobacillus sp.]
MAKSVAKWPYYLAVLALGGAATVAIVSSARVKPNIPTPIQLAKQQIAKDAAAGGIQQTGGAVGSATTPVAMPNVPSKILPASSGAFNLPGASQWDLTNGWMGSIGYVVYSVMGGAEPTNPQLGMLIVASTNVKTGQQSIDFYPLATPTGAVTIKSVTGSIVQFTTTGGSTGAFDLATLKFAS